MSVAQPFANPYDNEHGNFHLFNSCFFPETKSEAVAENSITNAYWYQITGGTHNATHSGDIIHNYGDFRERYAGMF